MPDHLKREHGHSSSTHRKIGKKTVRFQPEQDEVDVLLGALAKATLPAPSDVSPAPIDSVLSLGDTPPEDPPAVPAGTGLVPLDLSEEDPPDSSSGEEEVEDQRWKCV